MKEECIYYFNQFWVSANIEMLKQGKLTTLLERIYKEEFERIPKGIETRIFKINKNYKQRIIKGFPSLSR